MFHDQKINCIEQSAPLKTDKPSINISYLAIMNDVVFITTIFHLLNDNCSSIFNVNNTKETSE